MNSNHGASAEASQPADDLAQRKVRVAIADVSAGTQRECTVWFHDLPALIAGLSESERLRPCYSDDESYPHAGGVLILEAQAVPKHTETLLELFEWANRTLLVLWSDTAVIGVPIHDECGVLQSGRFIVALDDTDPAESQLIGDLLSEHSTLAGACIWRDGETRSIGGRVRVVDDVPRSEAAEHLSGSSFLSYGNELLPALTDEDRFRIEGERARCWPEIASDYERAASLLGSAEPVFFAGTRELSGPAVWDMMATLQRAALHPDPLAEFVRTKVVPLARQYRDDAADRARFDLLITSRLLQIEEYNALPPSEAEHVRRAAWLFAAPASLFVGKGAGVMRPLIMPGDGSHGEQAWLVEGLLPATGLCAVIGGAGEGKSQIMADLAARVATSPSDGTSRRFAGRTIAGAQSVLYFGSEGIGGWNARAERQIPHVSGRKLGEPHGLRIADGVPPLSSPIAALTCVREKVEEILRAGGEAPSLVIIDHLRAAMAGNEDNSGDMDLACSTASAIARMCKCCVVVVAHARKNSDGGNIVARGSSALRANLDFEATVKKDGNSHRLTVTKNRNGAEGDSFTWHIPALNAPVHEGEPLRQASSNDAKLSEQAAEVAGRVIRECGTAARGVTTRELNDALLSARPSLFLKADGKRDGSRLLRARADAVARGYVAEGKRGTWVVGDKAPPEIDASALFNMSKTPDALDDLGA